MSLIFKFLALGGIVLTVYYLTPCHFIISQAFAELFNSLIKWIFNYEDYKWKIIVIYVPLYIIVFICSLIYNEIIIIHLWELEENTLKYISFRERKEFDNSKNIFEDNSLNRNDSIVSIKDIEE